MEFQLELKIKQLKNTWTTMKRIEKVIIDFSHKIVTLLHKIFVFFKLYRVRNTCNHEIMLEKKIELGIRYRRNLNCIG